MKNKVQKIADPSQKNLVEMVSVNEVKKFSPPNPKGKIIVFDMGYGAIAFDPNILFSGGNQAFLSDLASPNLVGLGGSKRDDDLR